MRPLYTARDLTTDAYNYSSQEAIVVLTALRVENKIWGKNYCANRAVQYMLRNALSLLWGSDYTMYGIGTSLLLSNVLANLTDYKLYVFITH